MLSITLHKGVRGVVIMNENGYGGGDGYSCRLFAFVITVYKYKIIKKGGKP